MRVAESPRLAFVRIESTQVCVGKVLLAEVPSAEIVRPEPDSFQVLSLIASRGVELLLGEASGRCVVERCTGHDGPAEVGAGEVRTMQVCL